MKIIDFFKKNIFAIILFILIMYNLLLVFDTADFKLSNNLFIALIIEIILYVMIIFVQKMKKCNFDFYKKYMTVYAIIGFIYIFVFPIGSLPDETNHFLRGYEITNGHFISELCENKNSKSGGCADVTEEIESVVANGHYMYDTNFKKVAAKYRTKSKSRMINITNISMYSFVCYIPQALGILLGRILNLPILIWAYLARIFNFMLFLFLLNFSIKKMPYMKNMIVFISLLPITFQEAISMSADCMAIGSSLAFISYILYLSDSKKKIDKKNLLIIFILSFLISMSKLVYLPLCLLSLIIPKEKFESTKKKYLILFFIIFVVGIINICWLKIASRFLMSISLGANPDLQLKYVMSHPMSFFAVIYRTINLNFDWYTYTMLGSSLGTLCVDINPLYVKFNIIILLFLILFNEKNNINNIIRFISLFICLCVFGLICASLYLDWTPVANDVINGIQGRYFLPILPLIIIALNTKNFSIKNKSIINEKLMCLIMIMENIYVITHLINFY